MGSAARGAQGKRYRDLDAESPTVVAEELNPFRITSHRDPDSALRGSRVSPEILPVPPLRSLEGGLASGSFADVLSPGELGSIPESLRALGHSRDRTWSAGALLSTMAGWYLARSDEARLLGAERDALASQFHRAQREVEALRSASLRYSQCVARISADRDHYRAERDGLRAIRAEPSGLHPMSQEVTLPSRRHLPCDPYAHLGFDPPATRGPVGGGEGNVSEARYAGLAMPSLAEVRASPPRHPSYRSASSYDLDITSTGEEAGR